MCPVKYPYFGVVKNPGLVSGTRKDVLFMEVPSIQWSTVDGSAIFRRYCFKPVGSPRAPTTITVTDIEATSARIRWVIPYITSTPESYYVQYGLDPTSLNYHSASQISSGLNISTAYSQLLDDLDPAETYYFSVIASNDVGIAGSDIYSFTTRSGRK